MRHSLYKHGCFLLTKGAYFQNLCWNGVGDGVSCKNLGRDLNIPVWKVGLCLSEKGMVNYFSQTKTLYISELA